MVHFQKNNCSLIDLFIKLISTVNGRVVIAKTETKIKTIQKCCLLDKNTNWNEIQY